MSFVMENNFVELDVHLNVSSKGPTAEQPMLHTDTLLASPSSLQDWNNRDVQETRVYYQRWFLATSQRLSPDYTLRLQDLREEAH